MPGKPPLDLHAEVTLADGTRYRWDSGAKSAGDRPQGISFRTKKGDGFADASVTLSRRIDQDYVDLNLYDDFALVGYDGSTAYEGRVAANPRSIGDTHSMGVVLQGWMAHARDRKFTEVYVDADMSAWGDTPLKRKAVLGAGISADFGKFSWATDAGGLICSLPNESCGATAMAETWYTAPPGTNVVKVMYVGATNAFPAGWESFRLFNATDDQGTGEAIVGANLDGTLRTVIPATPRRYNYWRVYANGTAATPAAGAYAKFTAMAAYGTTISSHATGTTTPDGLYASDVIINICQRFCPKLSPAGVQATTYPIPHLVFKDAIAPYDAFLDINKYHLWNLAVYENKTLFFEPFDYTDYDWEVRLSDPGVTLDAQGDSVDSFANGMVVNFNDVATGKPNRITPTDDATLADTSSTNPANTHGLTRWEEISLSSPTTSTAATQIGVAALAEFNQPKAPGTIRVTGHIRDRAGHWQPVWKVRAGDRLIISDHPNDRVRLVSETDYSHDSKSVSIAVDSAFMRVDAVLDRISTALQAANLT